MLFLHTEACIQSELCFRSIFMQVVIIIIIIFHGLGLLTCSGIDALPSFLRVSTISSSSRFIFESKFQESGVVHSFFYASIFT